MSPEQQIDRSVLAGKDRDELHTIAGAIGVLIAYIPLVVAALWLKAGKAAG